MLNQLIEFLVCPIHGVLAPANWPMLTLMAASIMMYWRELWRR